MATLVRHLVYVAIFCYGAAAGTWGHWNGTYLIIAGVVLSGIASVIEAEMQGWG